MTIRMGDHEFDDVVYDGGADVIYMHKGAPASTRETLATPEGHAVMLDEAGEIVGITVVNAKWLADRDGEIAISAPERLKASRGDLAAALGWLSRSA
jgi:uncharacterized protein YuzE